MKSHGVLVMSTIIVKLPSWSLCIGIVVYKTVLEAYILKGKIYLYGNTYRHIYTFKGKCNDWYSSCHN